MAVGIPPPPLNSPDGSYYWLEWYSSLTNFINGQNIPWSNLNFAGSNITDIITRNHNDLQNIQGGDVNFRYHLVGIGSCSADASAQSLPNTWSLTHTAASGIYTIVHNQAIPVTSSIIVATSTGSAVTWCTGTTTDTNSFSIHTYSNTGVPTDQAFSFMFGTV